MLSLSPAHGGDAWRSFLQSEPLAVVTDIQMPVMDGRQLLANVRARNFRVPVIVVTASEAQNPRRRRDARLRRHRQASGP